ncbi:MAG: hypothetical protein PUG30_07060 [Actinomycetaceae bacterium]|nr:hypothetical protein [Actinomycetaceae bacterium]
MYGVALLVMTVFYFIFDVLFKNTILESYNGVTELPWDYVTFLGGLTAAGSAVFFLMHQRADAHAISNTTPRSTLAIGILDALASYVVLVLVPFTASYGVALAASALSTNRGYLDFSFALSALFFGATYVLVGEIVASIISTPVLAIVVAFVVGTVLGLYAVGGGGGIDNSFVFNPRIYALVSVSFGVALLVRGALARIHAPKHVLARTKNVQSGVHTAEFVLVGGCIAVFLLFSDIPLVQARPITSGSYLCTDVDNSKLCVWKEGDYRIPSYSEQYRRAEILGQKFGIAQESRLIVEEGLEGLQDLPPFNQSALTDVLMIASSGGEERSWSAAQAYAIRYTSLAEEELACEQPNDYSWFLLDLSTNYIYGDILFTGYSTSDTVLDSAVARIGKEWAGLSDENVAGKIAQLMEEYRTTCSIKELG